MNSFQGESDEKEICGLAVVFTFLLSENPIDFVYYSVLTVRTSQLNRFITNALPSSIPCSSTEKVEPVKLLFN